MILNMNVPVVNRTSPTLGDLQEDLKVAAFFSPSVVAVGGNSPSWLVTYPDIPFSYITQQVVFVASLCAVHQFHMGQV